MKPYLLILPMAGILGLAIWFMVASWSMMPGASMSGHGYAAMFLGILFTIVVGCGLMALAFYSNRRGYDDRADIGASQRGWNDSGRPKT